MGDELKIPRQMLEEVAAFHIHAPTDKRMQDLMDRNNNGRLSQNEREELESLVAISEMISLMRAKALRFLGRKP